MKLFTINTNSLFNIDVQLVGTELTLSITHVTPTFDETSLGAPIEDLETPVSRVRKLNLETLKQRPDFGDHALFMLYDEESFGADKVGTGLFSSISNLYAMTLYGKTDAGTYHKIVTQCYPLLGIYIPFAESPIDEWSLVLRVNPDAMITASENLVMEPGITMPTTGEAIVFPVVRFKDSSGIVSPDGNIDIEFYLETALGIPIINHDAEVYLEATGGTLTKRRVKTANGIGVVRFHATGLVVGDNIKVKCGFKYFSGTDDFMISVQ